ncbi:hypothetical protein HQQ81_13780 [Microbacteriaceae bacterium VKM Ac-2854]|nr:hypothetical protein [Microbacteriaceae bacterium VKM Ac-2854]
MGKTWTQAAVDYLGDPEICPRCDDGPIDAGVCAACGVDLRGRPGIELWQTAQQAAQLLRRRQEQVDALPTAAYATPAPTSAAVPAPIVQTAQPAPVAAPAPADPPRVFAPPAPAWVSPPAARPATPTGSALSVQSVLAVAGAGLFAVAAIVFTFFNPDLTNFATRSLIVGGVTAVFLGGAWLLARLKLQFSAEAVGALGMVFVVLDIWALARTVPGEISGWAAVGAATLLCSAVMIAIAALARIRSWQWAGLLGVAVAPAFFGYAGGGLWWAIAGHLAVGFAAIALHGLVERMRGRFDAPLAADTATLRLLQLLAVVVASVQLSATVLGEWSSIGTVIVLAVLAVLAGASAATGFARPWSAAAGAFAVGAAAAVPGLSGLNSGSWLAAVAGGAAVGVTLLGLVPAVRAIERRPLLLGGWTVVIATAIPAVSFVFTGFGPGAGVDPGPSMLALVLLAAGTWAVTVTARLRGEDPFVTTRLAFSRTVGEAPTPVPVDLALGFRATALWLAALASVSFATWYLFPPLSRVAIGLGAAVLLALLITQLVPRAPLALRLPLVVAAHVLLVTGAAGFAAEPAWQLPIGAAAVIGLAVLCRTVPSPVRAVHVGVGWAYALFVVGTALSTVGLEPTPVLCLTAALGSAAALAATLIRPVQPGPWYAILIVTAVPFLTSVAQVLLERSGWTALSTAVTFALALTLMLTRRPGLNGLVRSAAAALLVPSLAVVVVCLGAQLMGGGASPVALPIIAGIVAVVLPFTLVIEAALVRHRLAAADARASRLWIELSSLVTSALAVLLALARTAAGFETSFLVLVILGLGAAVTGVVTRRRSAWAMSAVSFTGALWSFWGLLGVTAVEPYVLPPALAAALVGAIFVARGLAGRAFYAIGTLAFAATPLGVLAVIGDGDSGSERWRVFALLALAVLLVTLAVALRRRPRLLALVTPTIAAGFVAAAAGSVQGVRFGLGLDRADSPLLLLAALGFGAAAALIGFALGRILAGFAPAGAGGFAARVVRTRWAYAPALLLLVPGPIASVRDGAISRGTMWLLTVALLALMLWIVTRARRREVTAPPVWFVFALAWCTAVGGWSSRELRVEAYSLPLGLALLAAGAVAAKAESRAASWTSWPVGHVGSWRRLTPGLVVTFLPSMLATGTDPQTWRAILVIALALAAILIGSLRRLGAPFLIGIIVLPIENVIVFAVQLGRSIGAAPWWITLATAGAVLLVIAVTSERRTRGGTAARLRDLN